MIRLKRLQVFVKSFVRVVQFSPSILEVDYVVAAKFTKIHFTVCGPPKVQPKFVQFVIRNPRQFYVLIEINLTNRFHVAVRLFSNGPQMTSKCGKNKRVA